VKKMKIDKKTLMKIIMEELEYVFDTEGLFDEDEKSGLKFIEEHQKEISIKMAQIALNKELNSEEKMDAIESVIAEYSELAPDVKKRLSKDPNQSSENIATNRNLTQGKNQTAEVVEKLEADLKRALSFLKNKDKKFNQEFLNKYFTSLGQPLTLAQASFLIAAGRGDDKTLGLFKDAYKEVTGKDLGPTDEEGGDKPTSKFDHAKFVEIRNKMMDSAQKATEAIEGKGYAKIFSGFDENGYAEIVTFIFNEENIKHFKQRPNMKEGDGNSTYILTLLSTMKGVAEDFFRNLKEYYLEMLNGLDDDKRTEQIIAIKDSLQRRFKIKPEEKRQDWEFVDLLNRLEGEGIITKKESDAVKNIKTLKQKELLEAIRQAGDGGSDDSGGGSDGGDGGSGDGGEKPDGGDGGSGDGGEKPDGGDEGSDKDPDEGGGDEGKDGEEDIDIDEEVKKAAVENAETTIKIIKSLIQANNLLKDAGSRVPDGASEEEQARIDRFIKDTDARIERLQALLGELEKLVDTDPFADLLPIIRDNIFAILQKSLNLVQGKEEIKKEKYQESIDKLMEIFTGDTKAVLGVDGYLDKVFAEFYKEKVVKLKDVDNAKVIQFFDELKRKLIAEEYKVKFEFIEKLRKAQEKQPLDQDPTGTQRVGVSRDSGGSPPPASDDDDDLPFEESKIRLSRNKVSSIISEEINKLFNII